MNAENYKIGVKIDIKNSKDFTRAHFIYIYVSYKGKRKYYNTDVQCLLQNFNGEKVVGVRYAKDYNNQIEQVKNEVLDKIQAVIDKYHRFELEYLDKVKNEYKTEETNFIEWLKKSLPTSGLADGTLRNNRAAINNIIEFGKIITFDDITHINIERYDYFLMKKNYTYDTRFKHHAKLRSFIRKAIMLGYDIDDPYTRFKMHRPKPTKLKYLEEEDLQKIVNFKSLNKTLNKVRDLFVFQAFTGLSYADAIKVREEDVKVIKGKKYIVDKRQKTLQEYAIRLYPESLTILERYNYDMNLLTNQSYNRFLKSLAVIVGVREDLTSHMARHTFATIALNRGVPLQIVAKMLGHSTSKCTEIYAQYLQGTIEREGYDKLEDIFG